MGLCAYSPLFLNGKNSIKCQKKNTFRPDLVPITPHYPSAMAKQKWFIVVNPAAGNGKGKRSWPEIEKLLMQMGIEYEAVHSEHSGHIIEVVKAALAKGYRYLAAVGGDGTAHEVVNGIFRQTEVPTQEVIFAMIPVGTGNDWIRTHGIPNRFKKAILLMKAGNTKLHDIGKIDYLDMDDRPQMRYFINVAGLGYDAFVTRASKHGSRWMGNKLYYLTTILRCVTQYKATRARLVYDDAEVEGSIYSAAVGICIYNGGGAQFVPQAVPDDGLFALTYFQNIGAWDVVMNSRRFYNGTVTALPQATAAQTKLVIMEPVGDDLTLLEADGEFLGKIPARFELLPLALRVIVP